MIKHRIYVRHRGVTEEDRLRIPVIKQSILTALDAEGVDARCEINMLITDDTGITHINKLYRSIDEATDVLSFPMEEFSFPGWHGRAENRPEGGIVDETAPLILGDIVISAEHVKKQAHEYGKTAEYETSYLTVHSVLHLLGYDHTDEAGDKKIMREREEDIMTLMKSKMLKETLND